MKPAKKTSIVAVANQKGGVAKSTSVVQLADAFASLGKKILVVDFDFQANTTDWFGLDEVAERTKKTTTHAIVNSLKIPDIRLKTAIENVDLIASEMSLNYLMRNMAGTQKQFQVASMILNCDQLYEYDIVLIDTHPSVDAIFESVMNFSHYFLVPIFASKHAYKGVEYLLKVVNEIKEINNSTLYFLGIFITNFENDATSTEWLEKLRSFCISYSQLKKKKQHRNREGKLIMFDTIIRNSDWIKSSAAASKPLSMLTTRKNNPQSDYLELAQCLLGELTGKRTGRPQPTADPSTLKPKSAFENEFGGLSL